MPTATSTVTKVANSAPPYLKGAITVTATSPPSPTFAASTTTATLHTLYNRAARAFLLRDIPLTYSLIESAFGVVTPPLTTPDALADHRRKWDILRITLESTVYSSPPASTDLLPKALQDDQLKSPQALITALHARSLVLFSPQNEASNPNSAHLPPQVLITLIYSSLRVGCPDVGRFIIEGWLARREVPIYSMQDAQTKEDSYEKVLELYCLHVLPRLEQWDYAREFLEYEGELSAPIRESFKTSLKSLQADVASSRRQSSSLSLPRPSIQELSRPCSPAPSSASSSSSLSTTSTSTVVPSNARSPSRSRSIVSSASSRNSRASTSSDSTATPAPRQATHPVLRSRLPEPPSRSSSRFISPPRSTPQTAALRSTNLSIYAIIKAASAPYLTASNVSTFVILFLVIPLLSLMVRARRRSQMPLAGVANNAEVARRRLQANGGKVGVVGKAWTAAIRVVLDTVRMAGSGLV